MPASPELATRRRPEHPAEPDSVSASSRSMRATESLPRIAGGDARRRQALARAWGRPARRPRNAPAVGAGWRRGRSVDAGGPGPRGGSARHRVDRAAQDDRRLRAPALVSVRMADGPEARRPRVRGAAPVRADRRSHSATGAEDRHAVGPAPGDRQPARARRASARWCGGRPRCGRRPQKGGMCVRARSSPPHIPPAGRGSPRGCSAATPHPRSCLPARRPRRGGSRAGPTPSVRPARGS